MSTTTQAEFHPMRGHVFDGATIRMTDGSVWSIKADIRGWRLRRADGTEVIPPTRDAYELSDAIVNHRSDITQC